MLDNTDGGMMGDEKPKEVKVVIRMPETLRDEAKAKAHRKDRNLSQVVRDFLRRFVREPNGPGEGDE